MRKITPQTKQAKDAAIEERMLNDETDELNIELNKQAALLNENSKSLIVCPIDKQRTYLSQADYLSERFLQGDENAVKELTFITEQANTDNSLAVAVFNEQTAKDHYEIDQASTLEERQQAWLQSQVMGEEKREAMKMVMRTFAQLQQMRIGIGNQVYALGRKIILGLEPAQSNRELKGTEAAKIMQEMTADYRKVSEGMLTRMLRNKDRFKDSRLDQFSWVLLGLYLMVMEEERMMIDKIEVLCEQFEVYKRFLRPVPGVGPLSSGKIIALLDPNKANFSSSFVKYCGLDVVRIVDRETGEVSYQGRSKRKAHLEEKTYIDRDGKEKTKLSITFNPEAKCALYNLAISLIKVKNRVDRDKALPTWLGYKLPVYADIYDDYKHKKTVENEVKSLGRTKMHIEAMSRRYMEKIFLQEMHPVWCHVLGMNDKVRLPYQLEHHDKIQIRRDRFKYNPIFTPLRDIVATHAVRGRKEIDELIREGIY